MIAFVRSVTRRLDQLWIDVQVALSHVDEDRRRARVDDHVRRRRPGDRRGDDLVSLSDSERDEREVHRRGAGGDREDVLRVEVLGHPLLEQSCTRPRRQPARAERVRDGLDLLLPDRGRLEAQHRLSSGRHGRDPTASSACSAQTDRPRRRFGRARSGHATCRGSLPDEIVRGSRDSVDDEAEFRTRHGRSSRRHSRLRLRVRGAVLLPPVPTPTRTRHRNRASAGCPDRTPRQSASPEAVSRRRRQRRHPPGSWRCRDGASGSPATPRGRLGHRRLASRSYSPHRGATRTAGGRVGRRTFSDSPASPGRGRNT